MPFAIPLAKPRGPDAAEQGVSRRLLFWSVTSVAISAVIYVWIYVVGLRFEDLFRGFSGALPWLTSTALASYKFNGLLLLVGLVPCVMLLKERNMLAKKRTRLVKLVALGFGLAWSSLTVFVIAAYLPVIEIGAAAQ